MQDKLSSPLVTPERRHVIESGKMEIQPELVCCQEVLDEVSAVLRSLTQSKGLRFDCVVPVTQIKIRTDRRTLRQILLDLADNAIRLTDSGSICIELRRCMDRDFTRVSTEFSVEARGITSQSEQQMNPENSTTQLFPQTQTLARLIGGRIEMMSIPGQGSIFRLVLPGK
jgi:signal transduction histidine kinase